MLEITDIRRFIEAQDAPYGCGYRQTLFDHLSPNDIFGQVLDIFYNGERCSITLKVLE